MHLLLIFLFALFGGLVWRLRGGGFTTLTGVNEGDDPDRLVTSMVLAIPLGFVAMVPCCIDMMGIFLGLLVSGWGPFQSMGLPYAGSPEKSWLRWLPLKLGFAIDTVKHDIVGLMEAGLLLVLPSMLGLLFFGGIGLMPLLLLLMIPLMPLAYLLPRLINLPTIPNFVEGQSWGEVFVGIFFASLLLLTT